jgi:hypothetical protein
MGEAARERRDDYSCGQEERREERHFAAAVGLQEDSCDQAGHHPESRVQVDD